MKFKEYKQLGDELSQQERWQEAATAYQQAVKLAPKNASAHYLLAQVQEKQGDLEGAIENYQKAITLNAEVFRFHKSLADALAKARYFIDAISVYKEAIKLAPNNANVNHLKEKLSQVKMCAEEKIPCTITLNVGSGLGDCLLYIKSMVTLADNLNFRVENIFNLRKSNRRISIDNVDNNLFEKLGLTNLENEAFLDNFREYQKIDIDFDSNFLHTFNPIDTKKYVLKIIKERAKQDKFYVNFNRCSMHFCVAIFNKYKQNQQNFNLYKQNRFLSSLRHLCQNTLELHANPIDSKSLNKTKILLHIRLGDTANIRLSNDSLISCHGKKGKPVDAKNPPERINSIEEAARQPVNILDFVAIYNFLCNQFKRDYFYITVISDGYDRGFDDIWNSKDKLKLTENEINQIPILRQKYKQEFFQSMNFADQIIYGENDQNLIDSTYQIIKSDIIITRSGHYVYQILDSFGYDKKYIFIKSSRKTTQANINDNFQEKIWEAQDEVNSINQWLEFQIKTIFGTHFRNRRYE
jgi:tetratricopeptide (TPR) repeat protein